MRAQLTLIPHVTINPQSICVWNQAEWSPCKPGSRPTIVTTEDKDDGEEEKKHVVQHTVDHLLTATRTANGLVSNTARKKITRALDYLLLVSPERTAYNRLSGRKVKYRLSFVTLTLPSAQVHSDNEIKSQCLNQFLIEARKRWHTNLYLWRAEKQRNGNIHFHIIFNTFIPHWEMRDVWNRIVNKLGYVDRYRDQMQQFHAGGFRIRQDLLRNWSKEKQLSAYHRGVSSEWNNPNSVDVHSVRKVRNIRAYVCKYMTKNEPTGIVVGRIWGASAALMGLKGCSLPMDQELAEELKELRSYADVKCIDEPWYFVMIAPIQDIVATGFTRISEIFTEFLFERFKYQPQTQFNYA